MTTTQRILAFLTLSGLLVSAFFFIQIYRLEHPADISAESETSVQFQPETNEQLIARLKTMLAVPSGETPTIATLADLAQVKGQAFFAHAEMGDKIIVYLNAKKAILYRPSTKQIIEVGPLEVRETGAKEAVAQ